MAVKIFPMEKKFEDEIHYILHVYGFANSYVMKREAILIFIGDYGERGKKQINPHSSVEKSNMTSNLTWSPVIYIIGSMHILTFFV